MPTGIIQIDKRGALVRLLDSLGAAQGAPPDGAAGDVLMAMPSSTKFFDLRVLEVAWRDTFAVDFLWPDASTTWLYETAGSGTMTIAYARVWLYHRSSGKAFPAGIGADTTKGYLNGGTAFGETGADRVRHVEPLLYPGAGDGINVELGTFGGTSPTFSLDMFFPAPSLSWRLAQESTLETMQRVLHEVAKLPKEWR